MEGLVNIVVAPFPYSDFSQLKQRPTLVLAVIQENDLILGEIRNQSVRNHYAISITNADFTNSTLSQHSNIRPEKITTIDRRIHYKVGSLKPEKIEEVVRKAVEIIHYFKHQDSLTPCLSISR